MCYYQGDQPIMYKEEALAGAATKLSKLSPTTGSSNSQNLNQSHIKCYYDHTYCCSLDYFNDFILDESVIYADETISVQQYIGQV